MKHKKAAQFAGEYLTLLVAAAIRGFSVSCILVPNHFAPGGITGLGTLIENMTGFPAGYTYFLANIPLVVLAFIFLGKEFSIKSALAAVGASAFMVLFQMVPYTYTDERILAAVLGGVLNGVSLALALKVGGTMGGTDILGTFVQRKHTTTNVSWFITLIDSTVVLVSLFFYKDGITPAILALTEMFAASKTCEVIVNGMKSAVKFEIVTTRPAELSQAILERMRRGVTKLEGTGMYTAEERDVLFCIVRRRQVTELRKLIKEIDPQAFAYITPASEVYGQGFAER